jgi:hypothetical protein
MAAVYVPLTRDVKDALLTLAEREDRDPRRQAARLLRESLVRAGALPADDLAESGPTMTTAAAGSRG